MFDPIINKKINEDSEKIYDQIYQICRDNTIKYFVKKEFTSTVLMDFAD